VSGFLHHKVQKFSFGTGSPGWTQKKGHKTVVCVCMLDFGLLFGELLAWSSVWSDVQRFAYGPPDATATPSSLAPVNPEWFTFLVPA